MSLTESGRPNFLMPSYPVAPSVSAGGFNQAAACVSGKPFCFFSLLGAQTEVSFVNSICTIRGGTHVAHVSDQIVEAG